MPTRARIHDNDGSPPGRAILLTHHQLGSMGCCGPVDSAQVIAVAVGADGCVVLPMQGDHVGDGALLADTVSSGPPTAADLDPRQDKNVARAWQRCGDGGEAE